MRLRCLEDGHAPAERAALAAFRAETGMEPRDVVKLLHYRPELFGRPFSDAVDVALRGKSDWTVGERELFAAFVSSLNQCPF
jgi:hypothetical protein